jgi:hypothetical protein
MATPLPVYGGRDVGIPAATATMSGPFRDRFAVFGPDSPLLATPLPVYGGGGTRPVVQAS